MMRHSLVFAALCFLGACGSYDAGGRGLPVAQMTFDHVRPYPLYVASYEVDSSFMHKKARAALPDGFVADPANLISDYLAHRFEAAGTRGKLSVVLQEASVEREVVASKHKVGAFLGVDQKEHYFVRAALRVQFFDGDQAVQRDVTLKAHRHIFMSEHLSLAEREALQMQGLDGLIDDLDISVRKVLAENFSLL